LHPRTILRAVSGEPHPYWVPSFETSIPVRRLARAFGCKLKALESVLKGDDEALTEGEAAARLSIAARTLRYRAKNRPDHLPSFHVGTRHAARWSKRTVRALVRKLASE
jgi:hypothetical protein